MDLPGKSRLDKNLIISILERIGHEEIMAPKKRSNKVLPRIPKDKPYLTKRKVDKRIMDSLENRETGTERIHTYRSRLDAFKPERLFVDDDHHLPGKSITTNIDPEFYSIVAGRAIKDSEKLADYRWAVRSCFLTRLKSSKLHTEIASINKEKKKQNHAFQYAYEVLCEQSHSFDRFLEEDYRKSAQLLVEAEDAVRQSIEQENEMLALEQELECVQSKVVRLDEQWQWYQTLRKFLFSISPLHWLSENENDELYFKEPEQLAEVFSELEDQNLGYLVQCENLQPAIITMENARGNEIAEYDLECAALVEDVNEIQSTVNSEVEKLNELKKEVDELCSGHVYELVFDKKTINLTACLEDAYERVVGPNDSRLNPLEMMRVIETTHEKLKLQLDLLPADLVKRITAAWEREEKRLKDEAKVAAKKVHQMEMLVKRFRNAVKCFVPNPKRRLMERSKPPKDVIKTEKALCELTTEEWERKYFFEFETSENNPDLKFRPMC